MLDAKTYQVTEYSDDFLLRLGNLLLESYPSINKDVLNKDNLRIIVRAKDKALFVAEINGELIGTATVNIIYGVTNNKAWLRDFIVDKNYQNQGIGSALWQAVVEWCNKRKIDLLLSTNKDNLGAQSFYQKQGAKALPNHLYFYKIK
jgi:GNAT superfamily N-acetyltransferase